LTKPDPCYRLPFAPEGEVPEMSTRLAEGGGTPETAHQASAFDEGRAGAAASQSRATRHAAFARGRS
jgi:hypothetical protein